MNPTLLKKRTTQSDSDHATPNFWNTLLSYLQTWEIYPIMLIAGFLRLYRVDTVVFDDDQAAVFRMAHDAIVHGLLPITSNRASVGTLNPPLVIYIFMLPAAISSNPLWGEVLVGLCNTAAVLVAYIFTRRYFGRLAAIIAALLFATATGALSYSRDIWPQNLLPLFVMLYIFLLFRAVVERRKGWLFLALLLFGVLYELHGSSLLLFVPLLAAVIFAPKTVRIRDIVFAVIALFIITLPYLLWEYLSHLSDINILLSTLKSPSQFDTQAIHFYQYFLTPYVQSAVIRTSSLPTDPHSILVASGLHYTRPFLRLIDILTPLVLFGSVLMAGILILLPQNVTGPEEAYTEAQSSTGLSEWLKQFYASPYRQGVTLLLIWQIVLPVLLLRHAITLEPHYFIIFLPGQFILIGLFISKIIELARRYQPQWHTLTRYGMLALAGLILAAQLIGSVSALIDDVQGNFNGNQVFPSFNDLGSLQHALTEADQLAQQRHLHRLYITTSFTTERALRYLAEDLHTPATLFDTAHGFILPGPQAGPVVFLELSDNALGEALIGQYTNASLIDKPHRIGEPPFKLYVLTAKAEPAPGKQSFTTGLQLLDPQVRQMRGSDQQWLVTRWTIKNSTQPATRMLYSFYFQAQSANSQMQLKSIDIPMTSMWAGDQLIAAFEISKTAPVLASITLQASTFTTIPLTFKYGPLTLTTFDTQNNPSQTLQTSDGQQNLTLSGVQGLSVLPDARSR